MILSSEFFFYPLYLLKPANTGASAYNAEIMAFLIMKFIHDWEAVGNKLNKRNELLITESQCDFFCFIPSASGQKFETGQYKNDLFSLSVLFCQGRSQKNEFVCFKSQTRASSIFD